MDYMSRLLVSFAILLLTAVVSFFSIANAATSATVAATVTPQNISVSVSDGTIAYGTLDVSTSKSTIASQLNDTQTVTNSGNVSESFTIKGQNSANWTLAGTAGANQYVHKFCIASCSSPPTNFTALTTSYQTLASGIVASGTQTFDLQLTTPSSTTAFTAQSVDITVLATAP